MGCCCSKPKEKREGGEQASQEDNRAEDNNERRQQNEQPSQQAIPLPDPPPRKVLDAIADNAYRSLAVIEFWRGASSNHPTVSNIIQDIRGLGSVYFDAIDASIHTAEDGYGFSSDAIHLCNMLLDARTNPDDLRQYIQGMKDKAQLASGQCTQALNKFREVRRRLNEIEKRVRGVVQESNTAKLLIHAHDKSGKKYERDTGLVDAIYEFGNDLEALSRDVDKFASWWIKMDTELKETERCSIDLRPRNDKERVRQVRETWSGVKEDYLEYKTKIIRLQDYYPPPNQRQQQGNPTHPVTIPSTPPQSIDFRPTPDPTPRPSGSSHHIEPPLTADPASHGPGYPPNLDHPTTEQFQLEEEYIEREKRLEVEQQLRQENSEEERHRQDQNEEEQRQRSTYDEDPPQNAVVEGEMLPKVKLGEGEEEEIKEVLEEELGQDLEQEGLEVEEEEEGVAEDEKKKEAAKQRRKEKEKAKKELAKKEGRLLTDKQKKERRATEARRQALLQSGVIVEGLSKKVEGSAAAGTKKIVYGKRPRGSAYASAPTSLATSSTPSTPPTAAPTTSEAG